jgi:hypothetical protein
MEYLKGGQLRQGPNRNELYLCKISQFGNPLQMTTIVTKNTHQVFPIIKDIAFGR